MSEEITRNLPDDPLRLILARLDSIDSQLARVDSRLDGIESRLTTVEDKVDKRLVETKPIWERALAEIAEVRTEMRERFENLQKDMDRGFHRASKQMDILNNSIMEVRTDLRFLEERVTKLEST